MRVYPQDSLTRHGKVAPQRRKRRPARARPARGWPSRVLHALLSLAAIFVIVTVGTVVALRWVTPPFSAVMWLEPGPVAALEHRWASRSEISVAAARAVIAAEDQ